MTITNLAEPHEVTRFLYDADKPEGQRAILYFSASWCRPCQNMQGIVEQLHCHANEIAFGSIDVAQAPTLTLHSASNPCPPSPCLRMRASSQSSRARFPCNG
ncbi:thioredoxin family protein [Serratia marcescens]